MDQLGRSAQVLLGSLDSAADVASGTESYVWTGSRLIRGWTIEFVLLGCLLPFLAATIDLFARCRRRHIALQPALRSLASRLGLWLWAGFLLLFFSFTGIFPNGESRPIAPSSAVATDWPVAAICVFAGLVALGWLVTRPRLIPMGPVSRTDELGGHLAAMLALGLVALVVAAQNPFALIFILPSLHAWLWLPHASERGRAAALGVFAIGFVGPLLLLGSFAFRYGFGFDAIWYLTALTSVGLRALHPCHRFPRMGSRSRAGRHGRRRPLRAVPGSGRAPAARADPGVDPSGGSAQPSHARAARREKTKRESADDE